jgi:hypothetical protein
LPKALAGEDDETFNRRFIKGCRVPTRATEAGDRIDASHARPPQTAPSQSLLHERIQGKAGGIYPEYAGPGGKALYKAACAQAEGQGEAGPRPRPQPRGSRQPDDIM